MSKTGSSLTKPQKPTNQIKTKTGSYISYNSLAGKIEIKSVSEAMREYIKTEFKKIEYKDKS